MTDAEMVKAMEICKDKEIPCDDCPLVECGDCEGISRQYFYDRFKQLQSENAALRERFATLNKMPCNIGDTVYVLFGSCYRCEDDEGGYCWCEKRGKDKIFEMKVGSVRFDKDGYYLYEDPIGITSGLSCSGRNYGKTWFLSMEEAKNHLMKSYDDVKQTEKELTEEGKDD